LKRKLPIKEGVIVLPNVRPINEKKYQISKHRFCELYNFCLQYNEWRAELQNKTDSVRSTVITDMPVVHGKSDSTQVLAMRRKELSDKCRLVEQTAIETDADIYPYLLKAVTNEGISYNFLKEIMNIPCGKDMYYDRRRKFYWLLSQKK